MQKIKLRTKVEIIILVAFITILVTISAAAITRTITDTSDNVDTYIRNSNGKYWEVSEANIQAAIDDLNTGGFSNGIVWIPGDKEINIYNGLVLKRYVTLDLQGSYLNVRANVDGVTMAEGSTLRGGTIDTRNSGGTYTKAAIVFNPSVAGHNYWTGQTRVQNMYLQGPLNEGAGIEYRLSSQGNIAAFTLCENIQIYKFKYGIKLDVTGGTNETVTYANSNIFNNIHIIYPEYAIYLNRNEVIQRNHCGVDGNIFSNIMIQTGEDTQRVIWAEGRYNIFDNIFTWDWGVAAGMYAYEFTSDAEQTYLKFFGATDYYMNNGSNNYLVGTGEGLYSMRTYNQATEPDIPNNTMAFWRNTSNNKCYIIQDFSGTQKKAELT